MLCELQFINDHFFKTNLFLIKTYYIQTIFKLQVFVILINFNDK